MFLLRLAKRLLYSRHVLSVNVRYSALRFETGALVTSWQRAERRPLNPVWCQRGSGRLMRLIQVCVVIGSLWDVTSTVRGDQPANNGNAVLESFFRDYLEAAFRLEPMMATRLGEHRFDDQLDDLSQPARNAILNHDRAALAELGQKVNFANLSRDGQIDYGIFRQYLERNIWLSETFHPFKEDPRVYGSYITESVYLLLT